MSGSIKLSKFDIPSLTNHTLFISVVGNLQYLSLTKSDISFAVNKVCQFMNNPKLPHWTAIKKILKYLKLSVNHGLFFSKHSNLSLYVYFIVDWTDCLDDHCSTGGFCIFLGRHLISWNSREQNTVARSNTEVGYQSPANTTVELIWL